MGSVGRLGIALAVLLVTNPAGAFIFSEHSRITEEAMGSLVGDGGAEGEELQRLFDRGSLCPREGSMNAWDCMRLVADLAFSASSRSFP